MRIINKNMSIPNVFKYSCLPIRKFFEFFLKSKTTADKYSISVLAKKNPKINIDF